ncbi:MAG: ABC transporter permease [Opitutaceae bacterium]|nr:ABC transporter permease [Opitutaceae bacterium]
MKGSHLGLLWSFLNPLLLMSLYVFVFGFIFEGKYGVIATESRLDYAMGIFLSLSIFSLISEVVSVAPTIIISNPNFVKKVVFPLEILPAAAVGATALRFLISIVLVFAAMVVCGVHTTWQALWLIPILLPLLLMGLGLSWLISALGVFIRDIGQLTAFLSQALLYASAVFYSTKMIPQHGIWNILHYNPVLQAVNLSRDVVLWAQPINLPPLLYLYGASISVFLVGHLTFSRLKPAFADVI